MGVTVSIREHSRGGYMTRKMMSFLLGSLKIPSTTVKKNPGLQKQETTGVRFCLFCLRPGLM